MASKKKGTLSTFCQIFQFIETHDDMFAAAIRSLCMAGLLNPQGKTGGVTFLYPADKAYRQAIVDKAYSSDAGVPDEAVPMIQSLIIPAALHSAADFKKGPIGGLNGVLYEVADVKGGEVHLAGGVALRKREDFRLLAKVNGERLAVWEVTAGRLPLEGKPFETRRSRPAAVLGGAETALNQQRATLAATVETAVHEAHLANNRCCDPYLAASVSLLNFLAARHPEALERVRPIIDLCPAVTFYLLLEPFKQQGAFLLENEIVLGANGWNGATAYSDAVAEYKGYFVGAKDTASALDPDSGKPTVPRCYRSQEAIISEIDTARVEISGEHREKLNKVHTPRLICERYKQLAERNTIRSLGPILPDATREALTGMKKLWQDEVRFVLHHALAQVRQSVAYEPAEYAAVTHMLRMNYPGNNYEAEATFARHDPMRNNVDPTADYYFIVKFLNSTDFLYVSPIEVGVVGGSVDPSDSSLYNRNFEAARALDRLNMHRGTVSSATLAELCVYVKQHGALPREVAQLVGS